MDNSGINQSRWYDPTVGRWLSEDPSGLGPDSNPYRYCDNGPTDRTDAEGLATYPTGTAVPLAPKSWSYKIAVAGEDVGVVKISAAPPEGDYSKTAHTKIGWFLQYIPNPNSKFGSDDVGWIQHVVEFGSVTTGKDGKVESYSLKQQSLYDNGLRQPSNPASTEQPNESSRPEKGPWNEAPWYGGPGLPNGTAPGVLGHSPKTPLPQSAMYDGTGSDIAKGTGEQYIAQLTCKKNKGTVLFSMLFYVENGKIYGYPANKLVTKIKSP